MERSLPVLLLIRRKMPELSGNFHRIAEAVVREPEKIIDGRVADLARRCSCDSAQVVRFCQKLGLDGFSGLKNRIIDELLQEKNTLDRQIAPVRNAFEQRKASFAAECIRTVNDSLSELDETAVREALRRIREARAVYIAGFGASALAAQDLCGKLLRLGFHAVFQPDVENMRTLCGALTAKELLIAISFSGTTADLLDIVRIVGRNGVPVLALTNYPDSALAEMADTVLLTAADEQKLRVGAMTSLIAQLVVSDMLVSLLAGLDRAKTEKRVKQMLV